MTDENREKKNHHEKKKTAINEQQIFRQNQFLNRLTETSPVGIVFVDVEGKITYANPEAEKVLRLSKSKIENRTYNDPQWQITDFNGNPFPDEKLPFFRIKKTLRSVFDVKHAIKLADKQLVYLSINAAPLLDSQKQFDGIVATITDITASRQAEEALKENEQFLQNVLDSVQDGISVLNPDLTVRHVNRAMKEWYSKNAPLEGKKCYEVYHNSNKTCDLCPTLRCLKSGKTEWDFVPGLPGSPIEWIELFSYPIKDHHTGKVTEVVEFVRNITDRKKVEKAEKLARDQLRQILDLVPSYIFAKDYDGRFLMVNQALADLFKASPEEVIGKTDADYGASPDQVEWYLKYDRQVMDSGKEVFIKEERVLRKDGSLGWFQTNKIPYNYLETEEPAILGIAVDITERKQAEAELKEHRDHLEELVKKRTIELEEKNQKLEEFNKLFVGREFRIKELRDKVKILEAKLNELKHND